MDTIEELKTLAAALTEAAGSADNPRVTQPLEALTNAAEAVARSFGGSWLGYHSRVYYADLQPPPPGARWSKEWGGQDMSFTSMGSRGDWREFDADHVRAAINERAGNPSLAAAHAAAEAATSAFSRAKTDALSILSQSSGDQSDGFIAELEVKLKKLEPMSAARIVRNVYAPKGQQMSRDMNAINAGTQIPPHIAVLAEVQAIQRAFDLCQAAAEVCAAAASHLARKTRSSRRDQRSGSNLFIGHGRSPLWRELKDFLNGRLKLPWDEFNREPTAGIATTARLMKMLDDAAFAFLILTAEDETKEGAMQARMNVIHEVGLFQGRLGFERAIVLLEQGCTEFSNIHGLGQIRFPKGNISAIFEEIRRTLEREGLLPEAT